MVRERYGALIVATGAVPARPGDALSAYRYGEDARVVTQSELEHRLAEGARLAGASVVMVQGFGQPAFPVDTHIHRLAARWGLSPGTKVERTEQDLKRLFPTESWGAVHLQIIYFGREHCPARGHDFAACPICSFAASKSTIQKR